MKALLPPRGLPRAAVVQTALVIVVFVASFAGIDTGNPFFWSLALLWVVPMIITIELDRYRRMPDVITGNPPSRGLAQSCRR